MTGSSSAANGLWVEDFTAALKKLFGSHISELGGSPDGVTLLHVGRSPSVQGGYPFKIHIHKEWLAYACEKVSPRIAADEFEDELIEALAKGGVGGPTGITVSQNS